MMDCSPIADADTGLGLEDRSLMMDCSPIADADAGLGLEDCKPTVTEA